MLRKPGFGRRPAPPLPLTGILGSHGELRYWLNIPQIFIELLAFFGIGYCKQHFLYFLPLPHGHGSLRPTLACRGGAWVFC